MEFAVIAGVRTPGNEVMRQTAFVTIRKPRTPEEARKLIGILRDAGLHPMDLGLSTPLAPPGKTPPYPVQVPSEETEAAKEALRARR